jgi:hypothetical protein
MRWGNLLPLTVSLPWLLLSAITVSTLINNSRCSSYCMTAADQMQAVAVPTLVLGALIMVGVLFARRVKWSGLLLIAISGLSLAVWPYQLVWLTGGV